jgi:hypothetical protein
VVRTLPIILAQSEFTPYILLAAESDGDTLASYLAQPDGQAHLDHLQKVLWRTLTDTDVAGVVRSVTDFIDRLVPWMEEAPRQKGEVAIPTMAHVRYLKEMSKKVVPDNDELSFMAIMSIAIQKKHEGVARKDYLVKWNKLPFLPAQSEFTPYILLAVESDGDTLASYLAQPDGQGHLDHLQRVSLQVLIDTDVAGMAESVNDFINGLLVWQSYTQDFLGAKPSKASEASNGEGREGTA